MIDLDRKSKIKINEQFIQCVNHFTCFFPCVLFFTIFQHWFLNMNNILNLKIHITVNMHAILKNFNPFTKCFRIKITL